MRTLIIGGYGYIGSYLTSHLKDMDIDICDIGWYGEPMLPVDKVYKQDFNTLTKNQLEVYDVIILAAAHSSVAMCNLDPGGAMLNNVANFVDLVSKLNIRQKFIYMNSSCVYDGLVNATECDNIYTKIDGKDTLSLSKKIIDTVMENINNCRWHSLRLGSVCGISYNTRTDLACNAMIWKALNEGKLNVSNPDSNRPMTTLQEIGRFVNLLCINDHILSDTHNLYSFNTTFRELGEVIAKATRAELEVVEGQAGFDFSMSRRAVDTIYKNVLGNVDFLNRKREVIIGELIEEFKYFKPEYSGRVFNPGYRG